MTHVRAAVLPLMVTALAGCERPPTSPTPLTELPRPLTAAERSVITASNRFAFGLLREANRDRSAENVFLSPLSASMALGMTLNGARGATFDGMRGALGFGQLSQGEINASYRSLIDLLLGLDPKVQMLIGNSIWYRRTFPFEQAFFDTTRTYFDARVAGLDFADPGSVRTINGWVNTQTKGKIDSILESIDPRDVMYLINAVYFKGDWTKQFDRKDTRDAPFYDASGQRVVSTVRMMHRQGPVLHFRGRGFEAADLPYGAGAFSMTLLLPDRGVDVNGLLASLDAATWAEVTGGLVESGMLVELPRFRLEYKQALNDALTALGMGIAFRGGAADFTGMSPLGRELFISEVFQKSYVDVHEEGTEAAAVTKVGIGVVSAPAAIRFDRPFIFAIRERLSGTILFIGKMVAPDSPR